MLRANQQHASHHSTAFGASNLRQSNLPNVTQQAGQTRPLSPSEGEIRFTAGETRRHQNAAFRSVSTKPYVGFTNANMDENESLPGSPTEEPGPLQAMTPERVNRRDSLFSPARSDARDSSVFEKINQFNHLSGNSPSKHLERKTAEAAIKRAVLGREEAEAEMKRLREEGRVLRQTVDEGRDRERRVGERLEAVLVSRLLVRPGMFSLTLHKENYGRAKETHAHTQSLWEKEIRRARKENFKTQSAIVKLQEELKAARNATKTAEECMQREKERTKTREQEAFTARYQIVSVQEQLDQALERIKLVEQERDAFKTAAKNEEVARIAAEGRIPLPQSLDPADEFASPKKTPPKTKSRGGREPRISLSTMEIVSSVSSEMEIEELTTQLLWERQRADRAQEMVEFLQAECQMHCCASSKTRNSRKSDDAPQKRRRISAEAKAQQEYTVKDEDASQDANPSPATHESHEIIEVSEPPSEPERVRSRKEPRRSTIFCPKEGIFRTVSEQEAAALEEESRAVVIASPEESHSGRKHADEPIPSVEVEQDARLFARTPSVDPPAFAMMAQTRTSLDSALLSPRKDDEASGALPAVASMPNIPTVPDEEAAPAHQATERSFSPHGSPELRPHTSTASYTVTTTVPLRDSVARSSSGFGDRMRTPSQCSNVSFDMNDPAMTPTMTREQALEKIRERRRARSATRTTTTSTTPTAPASGKKGAATPAKGRAVKRDISAPTSRAGRGRAA